METLNKIKEIINVDNSKINNTDSFLNYIENNLPLLQEIKNLKPYELKEAKEQLEKFFSYFQLDFLNSDEYNETYAKFVKIAIYFYDKFNNIGKIRNFLDYFDKDTTENPYKYKIHAIIDFRQLSNIHNLPEKINSISDNLKKALDLGSDKESLINILKEYFNKLFSIDEFQDLNSRKTFIHKLVSGSFTTFLDEKSLVEFLNEKLKEETIVPGPLAIIEEGTKEEVYLEREMNLLKIELEEKDKTILGLEKNINNLNKENEVLTKELDALQKQTPDSETINKLKEGNKELALIIKKITAENNEKSSLLENQKRDLKEKEEIISDLEKKIEKISNLPSHNEKEDFKDINVAILGSDAGLKIFKKLFYEKYFENLGLDNRNIKFIETWKDEKKTSIYDLIKYDIILIGENDHYLKDINNHSCDGIYKHLKTDKNFANIKVEKIKPDQNSSKPPKITKSSLKKTLELTLDQIKIEMKTDLAIMS